jgi:hypothetical protein
MIRYFLAKGDKAGEAVIIEGLPTSTYEEEDGRRVELATVYMKTYCRACKKVGFISPSGPRLPDKAENGQQHALSGDINVCDCKPAPVFFAIRNMTETITSEDIARMNGVYKRASGGGHASVNFGEQFLLRDERTGRSLSHIHYRIRSASGVTAVGITDSAGKTQRIEFAGPEKVTLEIAHQ